MEPMTGKKKKKKDKKAAVQDEPLEGAEETKEVKDEAAAPAAESKKAKKVHMPSGSHSSQLCLHEYDSSVSHCLLNHSNYHATCSTFPLI